MQALSSSFREGFMPQCYDAEDTVLLADAEKAAKRYRFPFEPTD